MNLDLFTWSGLAGLALLVAGATTYMVLGAFGWPVWVLLGLAASGIGAYLSRHHQDAKQALLSRSARNSANALVLSAAVLAGLAFLQAILSNHNASWDLSKGQVNSLADETLKTVKGLDQKVDLLCFFADNERGEFETLVKRLRDANPGKLSYEFINPNKSPLKAQEYSVKNFGSTVVVCGEKHELITSTKEEDLLNALLKVTTNGSKPVYFITGHQELTLEASERSASEFKRALENSNFKVLPLNLVTSGSVPEDAAALVLVGPQTDFPKPELEPLKAYLARGGGLMVALEPRKSLPSLKGLLKEMGVKMGEDIVVDPIMRLFGQEPIAPIVGTFQASHPIIQNLQLQALFPLSTSLDMAPTVPAGVDGGWLARSNPTAWGYSGSGNNLPAKPGPNDHKGPLTLAVAFTAEPKVFGAEGTTSSAKARVAVYGSAMAFSNQALGVYNNQDLGVNTLRWMASDEKHVSIKARDIDSQPMVISGQRMSLIWLLGLIIVPGLIAVAGVAVAIRRNRAN
jgi:ABC-type uncharacterized transport system involved in gliding motility auxiliary subunit